MVEEVVLVVDVARVVLDPDALDGAELDTGADEEAGDDEVAGAADEDDAANAAEADDGAEPDCEVVPDGVAADEGGTADVDPEEKAVAVVIKEELSFAIAAGFNLYMVSRLPAPQISELFPAQVIEQSLWSVALTVAGLSAEPHQHSWPYSRPA